MMNANTEEQNSTEELYVAEASHEVLEKEECAPPAFAMAFGYGSNSKRKNRSNVQYYNHADKQSVLDLAKVPTRKSKSNRSANNTNSCAIPSTSKNGSKEEINEQLLTPLSTTDSHLRKENDNDTLVSPCLPRYLKYPAEPPTRVLDFLYLGTVEDATDVEFLHSHHIEVIINVSEEEYWTVDKNIVVFPFKVKDMGNFDISSVFAPTRKIINRVRKLYFDALNCSKSPQVTEENSSSSLSRSHLRNSSSLSKASNSNSNSNSNSKGNTMSSSNTSNVNSKITKSKSSELVSASTNSSNSNNKISHTTTSHRGPCVLVHCLKGRSRSATIVLAYLIYHNGWSVAEAMRYILQRRPTIEPNLGFIESLRQLQESMNVHERSKKCSAQSILLRNVALTPSSVESLKVYLERHVGLIRDVVIQSGPTDKEQTLKISHYNHTNDNEHEGNDNFDVITDNTNSCKDNVTDTNPLSHLVESTLCMVFFVCMENVARARHHISTHHSLFEKTVTRLNSCKPIKVILPNRLITSAHDGRRGKSDEAVTPVKSTMSMMATSMKRKKNMSSTKSEKESRTLLLGVGKVRSPISITEQTVAIASTLTPMTSVK